MHIDILFHACYISKKTDWFFDMIKETATFKMSWFIDIGHGRLMYFCAMKQIKNDGKSHFELQLLALILLILGRSFSYIVNWFMGNEILMLGKPILMDSFQETVSCESPKQSTIIANIYSDRAWRECRKLLSWPIGYFGDGEAEQSALIINARQVLSDNFVLLPNDVAAFLPIDVCN